MNSYNACWRLGLLWVMLGILMPAPILAGFVCASCGEPIRAEFFWQKTTTRKDPQPVCASCSALQTRCAICKLPLKDRFMKLEDGRLLCEHDAAQGIFEEREAQRLFEALKGTVFPLFAGLGSLPNRNIQVRLIDARAMAALRQTTLGGEDHLEPMALARSRRVENDAWEHEICVLQGLNRAGLSAVLAHEYTHVWLRENLPSNRRLDRLTVEGFCELVAYLVMEQQGEQLQTEAILANAYTRGQVQTFLQAKNEYHFYRIVRWMKAGLDAGLAPQNTERLLALEKSSAKPNLDLASLRPVATPVPEQLTLKGVSGRPGRRFALINDQTFQENEEANVRVGKEQVRIRCLDIGEQFVRVQVEGRPDPLLLRLDAKP